MLYYGNCWNLLSKHGDFNRKQIQQSCNFGAFLYKNPKCGHTGYFLITN